MWTFRWMRAWTRFVIAAIVLGSGANAHECDSIGTTCHFGPGCTKMYRYVFYACSSYNDPPPGCCQYTCTRWLISGSCAQSGTYCADCEFPLAHDYLTCSDLPGQCTL